MTCGMTYPEVILYHFRFDSVFMQSVSINFVDRFPGFSGCFNYHFYLSNSTI